MTDREPDSMPTISLRAATEADAETIAAIWHAGWRDGHLGYVPDELLAERSETSFYQRAPERLNDTTVAIIDGSVCGFVMVVGDEVEQVYLSEQHRGSGVAGVLLSEAERLVAANGMTTAWLAVVAGNARARRFYDRQGWSDEGLFDYGAAGNEGPVDVPCHRYVKAVGW